MFTSNQLPKISIITSTLNAVTTIEKLEQSISFQSYKNLEWIVIDSESTDGTVAFLKKSSVVDKWISEPDSGIYDAWNKGLKLADGEFVCFLGADDFWIDSTALTDIITSRNHQADLICSLVNVVDKHQNSIRILGGPWDSKIMEKYQVIAHPGLLCRMCLFKRYGYFNTEFAIAGDYEWLLRLSGEIRSSYMPRVTVAMTSGGVSERLVVKTVKEMRLAQILHTTTPAIFRDGLLVVYMVRIFLSRLRNRCARFLVSKA
jgi:glycosyltransferase involved in cell wall biosynthesis